MTEDNSLFMVGEIFEKVEEPVVRVLDEGREVIFGITRKIPTRGSKREFQTSFLIKGEGGESFEERTSAQGAEEKLYEHVKRRAEQYAATRGKILVDCTGYAYGKSTVKTPKS